MKNNIETQAPVGGEGKNTPVQIVVRGNSITVRGKTYPVKETLKKYKFKWDKFEKEWYNNTENYTAEEIKDLVRKINARLIVEPLPEDILEFIDERVVKTINELDQ